MQRNWLVGGMQSRYEAVLLDATGTLIHAAPSIGELYAKEAALYGVAVPPAAAERAFRVQWRLRRQEAAESGVQVTSEESEKGFWRHLVYATFRECCGRDVFGPRFETFFEGLFQRFAQPASWAVYEDVIPGIKALGALGLRMAVVSNFDRRLEGIIDGLGLLDHLEFVLTSAQAGRRKPDKKIFCDALSRMDLKPGDAVYVGDSYEEDVLGAQHAGLKAVLLDRKDTVQPKSDCPVIRGLPELPPLLSASSL